MATVPPIQALFGGRDSGSFVSGFARTVRELSPTQRTGISSFNFPVSISEINLRRVTDCPPQERTPKCFESDNGISGRELLEHEIGVHHQHTGFHFHHPNQK